MTKPNKRIYLINRDFQLRYSLAAVVVGILSTLVTLVVLLYPLYTFQILRIPKFLPLPIFGIMGLAAIVNILMVGLLGVFITHRIAGPMYSLVRSFRRIELGKWAGHLRIRENDDLKFLVRNFNQLVDGLVRQANQDLEVVDQAITMVNEGAKDKAGLTSHLEELKNRCQGRLQAEPDAD